MESLGILNFPLVFKFPTDKNLHSMHLQRDLVGISCGHSSTRDEEASPKLPQPKYHASRDAGRSIPKYSMVARSMKSITTFNG